MGLVERDARRRVETGQAQVQRDAAAGEAGRERRADGGFERGHGLGQAKAQIKAAGIDPAQVPGPGMGTLCAAAACEGGHRLDHRHSPGRHPFAPCVC